MTKRLRRMILDADIPGDEKAAMLTELALITAIVAAAEVVVESIAIETWNDKGWSWLKEPIAALKKLLQLSTKPTVTP